MKPRETIMTTISTMNPIVRKRSTRPERVYIACTAKLPSQNVRGSQGIAMHTPENEHDIHRGRKY
jgi:hypothetical protein